MLKTMMLTMCLGLLAVGATGCVKHVHHHQAAAKTVNLDVEHDDARILVVYEKPKPERHCRKHRRHWHCRAW